MLYQALADLADAVDAHFASRPLDRDDRLRWRQHAARHALMLTEP